jgi:hypothetical protein
MILVGAVATFDCLATRDFYHCHGWHLGLRYFRSTVGMPRDKAGAGVYSEPKNKRLL